MTNEQRIAKIDELLEKIIPLKKYSLNTDLNFSKKSNFRSDTDKEENLNNINTDLESLFTQLRQYQILYFVNYEVEYSNGNGQTYWEEQSEQLFFNTNCDIDTTLNGWQPYVNDQTVKQLLTELKNFLINSRASNFTIKHIKRIEMH